MSAPDEALEIPSGMPSHRGVPQPSAAAQPSAPPAAEVAGIVYAQVVRFLYPPLCAVSRRSFRAFSRKLFPEPPVADEPAPSLLEAHAWRWVGGTDPRR